MARLLALLILCLATGAFGVPAFDRCAVTAMGDRASVQTGSAPCHDGRALHPTLKSCCACCCAPAATAALPPRRISAHAPSIEVAAVFEDAPRMPAAPPPRAA